MTDKLFPTDYTEVTTTQTTDFTPVYREWEELYKIKTESLKWPKWDTGAQGIQWIKWDKWETWATGATGATWPQWVQWPQGIKWDKWDTGAQWPQGIQWPAWTNGTDWEDWISFTPKWAYSSGTAYVPNDVVSYLGSSWIALQNTTGNTPSEWAYWTLNAAKGTDGTGSWDISGSGTANELAYFTAEKTIDNLPVATYPSLTELSYVKWVTSAIQTQIWNQVAKSTYDANTILKADTDNTPAALTVWEQTLVGRKTWWAITALTPAEVRTMINVADWATAATRDSLWLDTDDSPQFAWIELWNASDTSLTRSAAWVLAVEWVVIPSISSTNTLTNKRINQRVTSAESYTTDTGTSLNVANCDIFIVTAQAGALKLNNPWGTPTNWQKLIVRIKDNGTARALTYDTQFRAMWVALPSTTVLSKTLYMWFIYNSDDTKRDLLAVWQES